MKTPTLFSAILLASWITISHSAPVSSLATQDLTERQAQTSAQGDCTSQSVDGQPQTVSGDCSDCNSSKSFSRVSPASGGTANRDHATANSGTPSTMTGTAGGNNNGTASGGGTTMSGTTPATDRGTDGTSLVQLVDDLVREFKAKVAALDGGGKGSGATDVPSPRKRGLGGHDVSGLLFAKNGRRGGLDAKAVVVVERDSGDLQE